MDGSSLASSTYISVLLSRHLIAAFVAIAESLGCNNTFFNIVVLQPEITFEMDGFAVRHHPCPPLASFTYVDVFL